MPKSWLDSGAFVYVCFFCLPFCKFAIGGMVVYDACVYFHWHRRQIQHIWRKKKKFITSAQYSVWLVFTLFEKCFWFRLISKNFYEYSRKRATMHQNSQVLSVLRIAISKNVQWIQFVFNVLQNWLGMRYALCVTIQPHTHALHKRLESFPMNCIVKYLCVDCFCFSSLNTFSLRNSPYDCEM